MKGKTIAILVILLLIVLYVRNPKRTANEIQTGLGGAAGVGGAAASGLLPSGNTATGKKKG